MIQFLLIKSAFQCAMLEKILDWKPKNSVFINQALYEFSAVTLDTSFSLHLI